jgi:hypothetical protein
MTRQECLLAKERGELTDWERQQAERDAARYAERKNLSEAERVKFVDSWGNVRWLGRELDFFCCDCEVDTRTIGEDVDFMDWPQWRHGWGQQGKGTLCIDCFEKRIGRRLVREDFIVPGDGELRVPEDASAKLRERLAQPSRGGRP